MLDRETDIFGGSDEDRGLEKAAVRKNSSKTLWREQRRQDREIKRLQDSERCGCGN